MTRRRRLEEEAHHRLWGNLGEMDCLWANLGKMHHFRANVGKMDRLWAN